MFRLLVSVSGMIPVRVGAVGWSPNVQTADGEIQGMFLSTDDKSLCQPNR